MKHRPYPNRGRDVQGISLMHVRDERLHDLLTTLEGLVGETNRWYAEEHVDDRQSAGERRKQARPERTAADVQRQLEQRYEAQRRGKATRRRNRDRIGPTVRTLSGRSRRTLEAGARRPSQ